MRCVSNRLLTLAVATALAAPATVFATNGYFLEGFGARARGMGGVGVAYAQDGFAAAHNPAGMTELNGIHADIGGEFFIPRRSAYHDSLVLPTQEKAGDPITPTVSGSNLFLIPSMGGVMKFNRKLTMGFAAVGAGLGTGYDQTVRDANGVDICGDGDPNTVGSNFFNFNCNSSNKVGVSMMQMQMLPSIAYRVTKTQSVGASLAIAIQTFRAYGLGSFQQLGFGKDNSFTNEGNDWATGGGVRLGWLGKFFDNQLQLGANYSSRVYMTKFEKYKNLFAEHGDFDIPENFAVGLSLRVIPKTVIAFDVQRNLFSTINSVANPGPNNTDPNDLFPKNFGCGPDPNDAGNNLCQLGKDKGMGFDWMNQTVYKLGADYQWDDKLTLRAGVNYGKAPIKPDAILFNLLAPATVERHLMLGATYQATRNIDLTVNYMHAFKNTIRGKTRFAPEDPNNPGTTLDFDEYDTNAAISMVQNALGFGFGYTF